MFKTAGIRILCRILGIQKTAADISGVQLKTEDKALMPYDPGKYERVNDTSYTYTDPTGRKSTIDRSMWPQFANNPVDEQELSEQPTWEQQGRATGLTDYKNWYNRYWASIPDNDWNKVFQPASREQRLNYTWPEATPMSTEQAREPMYYPLAHGINLPKSNREWAKRIDAVNTYDNPQEYNRTLFLHNLGGSSNRLAKPHEAIHSIQMAVDTPYELARKVLPEGVPEDKINLVAEKLADLTRLAGWKGDLLQTPEQIAAINSQRPSFNLDLQYGPLTFDEGETGLEKPEDRTINRTDHYTGKGHEEAQAIHAFRDSVLGAQKVLKEHPEYFAQLTEQERAALSGANPWFRSPKELETTMRVFRQYPHMAQYLGPEGMRALSIAQDYDNMSKYWINEDEAGDDAGMTWEEAEKLDSPEFQEYKEKVQKGRQRFYDMYMANNHNQSSDGTVIGSGMNS